MFAIEYHDNQGKAIFVRCQYMSDLLEKIKKLLSEGVRTMEVMRIEDVQTVVAPHS